MDEEIKEYMDACRDDMEKAISYLKNEYQVIRAGRANPHIFRQSYSRILWSSNSN